MRIEIAEPEKMTQTGSSLIRLIQNNNMPILDLLVRESIQNSLDAKKENSKYVEVEFVTGSFYSHSLGKELEGINECLQRKYGEGVQRYLAIRDNNTVGLTGVKNYLEVKDNVYGNLIKLVYEICKPQDAEGAGGSWGIGKTVYFRVGIGLVIYYSRIINENGAFESRLAASYVEDENSEKAMIPVYKDLSKRGIAWWGEQIEENKTQPITDEMYIEEFLDIFGVRPYEGTETGTTIIIPYINDEQLLINNRIEYLDDQGNMIVPFWGHTIEEYLSISVQRWYAPRLNNIRYAYGPYLRLKINGNRISADSMEPVFKTIQALYNSTFDYDEEDDILFDVEDENKIKEKINVTKYLYDKVIGTLAIAKISKTLLEMTVPNNKPDPTMYFNIENHDTDENRPIICYTRKPAMIVSYENLGAWVPKNVTTEKNEYLIGIFVLKSENRLKNSPLQSNLEEYIRKSEMADHTSWMDWSIGSYNPRLVSKIQSNINKIASKAFVSEKETDLKKFNSGFGKLFGEMLLPPEGFGTKASGGKTGDKPKGQGKNKMSKKNKFDIVANKIKYSSHQMIVPLQLNANAKEISQCSFDMFIDSEAKKISMKEWEEKLGIETPFYISEFEVFIESLGNVGFQQSSLFTALSEDKELEGIQIISHVTKKGTVYGISLNLPNPNKVVLEVYITVELNRKDIKPVFDLEIGK